MKAEKRFRLAEDLQLRRVRVMGAYRIELSGFNDTTRDRPRVAARQALLRAGLPITASGTTIDRQCSSGLQAIALASHSVRLDGVRVAVAGGFESISLAQNHHMNTYRWQDPWLLENKPEIYMPMIDTAEIVAERYGISREAQDEYALESQLRTAAARQAGRFDAEIVPITTMPECAGHIIARAALNDGAVATNSSSTGEAAAATLTMCSMYPLVFGRYLVGVAA